MLLRAELLVAPVPLDACGFYLVRARRGHAWPGLARVLLLPRSLVSRHLSGHGRRVKAREATAERLGLDRAVVAETIVQRGDDTNRRDGPGGA